MYCFRTRHEWSDSPRNPRNSCLRDLHKPELDKGTTFPFDVSHLLQLTKNSKLLSQFFRQVSALRRCRHLCSHMRSCQSRKSSELEQHSAFVQRSVLVQRLVLAQRTMLAQLTTFAQRSVLMQGLVIVNDEKDSSLLLHTVGLIESMTSPAYLEW